MKPGNRERIVMEFAAGLLACAGGYALLVQPAQARLAQANAQLLTLVANGSGSDSGSAPSAEQLASTVQAADAAAALVRDRSAIATDEASLFETIMRLASEHGVRIDHLQPTDSRAKTSTGAPPPPPPPPTYGDDAAAAAPPPPPTPQDTKCGYSISVIGRYADIAAFIGAFSQNAGFTVVRSIRLTPGETPGADEVEALLQTEHHAFETPSSIQAAGAASPAPVGPSE